MIKGYEIYPLSAIPLYHVKDTGFRLNAKTLKELENIECLEPADSLIRAQLTKNTNILMLPSLQEANNVCKKYLDIYLKKICGYSETFIITNSWLTIHKKGSVGHEKHTHQNSIFSGCLYLDTGVEESSIDFYYKVRLSEDFNFEYVISENNIYNSGATNVKVKTGDIIIFPSSLLHSVPPITSDKTRIALCFNTFVKDKFGNKMNYSCDLDLSNVSCGNESNNIDFKYD
jgi:uncharacterized protein (TIGR02466 family)